MLSVTGINRFYYLRGFTDMCCKHSHVYCFGSKRQFIKKDDSDPDDDPVDREKEKDGFDGTEELLDSRFVPESTPEESRPSSPNPRISPTVLKPVVSWV